MTVFLARFRSTRGRFRAGMARKSVVWLALVLGISGAAQGQSHSADDSKSPREWVAALRGDDPKAREAARWALYRLGPKAKEAVPDLIAALDDPRKAVREGALESLQAMGPAAAPAAAALARKLGDASLEYTTHPAGTGHVAAYILVQIGASGRAGLDRDARERFQQGPPMGGRDARPDRAGGQGGRPGTGATWSRRKVRRKAGWPSKPWARSVRLPPKPFRSCTPLLMP